MQHTKKPDSKKLLKSLEKQSAKISKSVAQMKGRRERASGLRFEVYQPVALNAQIIDPKYTRPPHEWRWRLRSRNGKIIASGEGYKTKAACLHAIEVIRQGAAGAAIEEEGGGE